MGDDNINTLKQSSISTEYLNLLRSEGFSPLLFEATRVTESNQTCIDHIYTNVSLPSTSGSIAMTISRGHVSTHRGDVIYLKAVR